MKRKVIAFVAAALLAVSSGSLFANGSAEAPATEQKVTELQLWTWRPEDVDFYNGLIKQFEAANPDIKVTQNAIKNTEYNTVLASSLSGGSGPDIFMGRAYGGLLTYVQSGYLEPMDKLYPEVKNYSKGALGGASDSDGNIWGLPAVGQTLCVYYNKKIFEENGITVPDTWDEFLADCKTLKAKGILPIANGTKDGWTVETLLGVIGPAFYGPDFFDDVVAGKTNFLDPRFIGAINKIHELTPYMPDMYTGISYTDMQTSFINEMSAMFLGGSYEASYFKTQNPDLDFDIFPIPGTKASDPKLVSVYADMNWVVNAASQHMDADKKFIKFLASKEVGQQIIDKLQMVPWTPGVDASSSPFISKVLELQKTSTPYLFLVGFRYQQPTGSSLWQAAGQGFMSGDLTAEQTAEQVQKGIASYYKPFQK